MKHISHCFVALLLCLTVNLQSFAADPDVTINSKQELIDFVDNTRSRLTVNNLTIKAYDITNSEADYAIFIRITEAIKTVNGKFKLEGVGIVDLHWFPEIEFNGGFEFKNLLNLIWIQKFSAEDGQPVRTHVNGDFILDNCPNMAFPCTDSWHGDLLFGGFERVEGDFILKNFGGVLWNIPHEMVNPAEPEKGIKVSGKNLTYVGGDFIISTPYYKKIGDMTWTGTFGFPKLQHVGGSVVLDGGFDNEGPNGETAGYCSLSPLTSLTEVGKNLTVVNLPNVGIAGAPTAADVPGLGLCYIKYMIDAEYINYACYDVTVQNNLDEVNLNTLGECADGVHPGAVYPLPAKDPDCYVGTGIKQVQKEISAQVYVVNGQLKIYTVENLAKVELFDAAGKKVLQSANTTVDIQALAKGAYIVRLTTVNNHTGAYKIVK
ncbi:MAG: T9SS type A sorting domain-containing protein [Candidatus Symbiothrix sp.]|jgi:hypothetical protein|nr:T9SS type A sorting domain-containing protein [Candidatus Symbiothrix sp.]